MKKCLFGKEFDDYKNMKVITTLRYEVLANKNKTKIKPEKLETVENNRGI